ncbi:MAG: dihydroxyacetone kinase subunit DhaL [Spirochaetaceae bacterium]|nr:dihydroxyacetone kinase subunit DhaL [Spirochaetaceae bacterium]
MNESFENTRGQLVVKRLVDIIHENREELSRIDGLIGDGDHGINMDKGFQLAGERLTDDMAMSDAFKTLGRTLLMEIGGSMGPLYGQFFRAMAIASADAETITTPILLEMLEAGYEAIRNLGNAKPGDKTLVDTLHPAVESLKKHVQDSANFSDSMKAMIDSAEIGWKSTEALVAKIGRASRLGERSRGILDAGATSCFLILKTIGETSIELSAL